VDISRGKDKRDWSYAAIRIFDLGLSAYAKIVYAYLCSCADNTGQSSPSLKDIAKKCSIKSRQTVLNAIKELNEAGLIDAARRTGADKGNLSTLYTVYQEPLTKVGSAPAGPGDSQRGREGRA
jgi:predicted transcriptional regulator